MIKCALQNNEQISNKRNNVRIPTGRRLQTSWLFTKRGGVEFRTTKNKINPVSSREGPEPKVQFNKTFTSIIYKHSYCLGPLKQ